MKNISLFALSALLVSTLSANDMSVKQEGVKYIKMLGKELKSNLVAHMKADPTGVEAMGFCTGKAESITTEINGKLPEGVSVRRTSLKTRSEKNSPDVTDIKVMEAYNNKIKEGKFDPKDIQVVELENSHRVYKPLLIKKACMKCHGDEKNISPQIKSLISKVYPKDMAVNFKEGDLRGVIVSEMKK